MGSIPYMSPWWGALKQFFMWQATEQTKIFFAKCLSLSIVIYRLYSDCLLDFLGLMLVLFLFIPHFQNQNPQNKCILTLLFQFRSLATFTTLLKPKC